MPEPSLKRALIYTQNTTDVVAESSARKVAKSDTSSLLESNGLFKTPKNDCSNDESNFCSLDKF